MAIRLILALWLAWVSGQAQQPFPMDEIDEIGHMDSEVDDRKVADLGLARAFSEDHGPLLIEGSDDEGNTWRAHMERIGGVGWTRVFTADFDANGRKDLLFLQFFLGNGRCLDGVTVTTLLFDESGRPVPWRIETHGLDGYDGDLLTLLDEDGDGKAELATSGCKYSKPPRHGEDRRLTGIYEAEGTLWRPLQPPSLEPYVRRFQQESPPFAEWGPAAESWPDPHAGWDGPDDHANGLIHRANGAVRPRYRSGGIGREPESIVIDSPVGRELFLLETEPAYRRILAAGAAVRLLGNGKRTATLWARLDFAAATSPLESRISYRAIEKTSLRLEPARDRPPDATVAGQPTKRWAIPQMSSGSFFSREGRCFQLGDGVVGERSVVTTTDCTALRSLQSDAAQGKRVRLLSSAFSITGWVLEPSTRRYSTESGLGARMHRTGPVEIQPLPDHPGDLIAVIPRDRGFLAQWRLGARSWLTLHDAEGRPTSPAIDPQMDGELFLLDEYSGKTCFLRWDANDPVELTCATADVELARSP